GIRDVPVTGVQTCALRISAAPADAAPRTAPVTTASTPAPEPLPACEDSFELNLKGLTQEQVEGRFGPPSQRETFRVEERGGEFYATVQNAYPTTDRKNWDVPIQEWTWTSGECILTV